MNNDLYLYFQANKPPVVFLSNDLASVMVSLLELFIKPSDLGENTSGYKLATLNIHDTKNQVLSKKVDIGNGARQALEVINV